MLDVTDLTTGYGAVSCVESANLSVVAGELVAVVGANGAGKSAMLLAMAGLLDHTGSVVLDGEDLTPLAVDARARAGLGLVPEGRMVFAGMTVEENLLSGAMHPRGRAGRAARREFVLDLFPRLGERLRQPADSMSGGEQQMVAIGRTLMSDPRLLILDEPTLGLSPKTASTMFEAIEQLRSSGLAILLIEQDVHHALTICDGAHVMARGVLGPRRDGSDLLADDAVREAYLGA